MATCPNKSHPDWKALVAKVGEKGANLAYVKNGFEIPRQDGLKQAPKQTTIRPKTGILGNIFRFANTMDSMINHPEVAAEMIDELKALYPEIRVFKDRIIDENGNYLEIPSGKEGRHYRNAFLSAVAWTNDSFMETPPHEYAHEYIDMYRNHPLVSNAIEKYGEEKLVTLIGRKYAGRKMSNSFQKFLDEFWRMIKRTIGAPSVVDVLTDSFAKNEILGDQYSRGTEAVHNFQDSNSPMLEKQTFLNFDEDTESAADEIHIATQKEVARDVTNSFIKEEDFGKDPSSLTQEFDKWWRNLIGRAKVATRMEQGSAQSSNFSAMDDSIITAVNDVIVGDDKNKVAIIAKIQGEDIKLNQEQEIALKNIYKIFQGTKYKEDQSNVSFISPDVNNPKLVKGSVIESKGVNEVIENFKKKAKRLASKHPIIQWIEKGITKQLKWVTNSRLWAKYASGSENSIISRVLYKSLNDGREKFSEFSHDFKDFFTSTPDSYYDGSTFHNSKASISELETKTIDLNKNANPDVYEKSIELTKAELLMIYLTSRQKNGMSNLKAGITLKTIEGRPLKRSNEYKLTDSQLKEIISEIEKDPQAQELVAEIDKAMKYNHAELNKTFRLLEGFDLEQIENYFPMFHGNENMDIGKSKNIIEDMRNLRLRTSKNMSVRLEDPFKVLSGIEMSNAAYVGYAIPIHNAKKMITALEKESLDTQDVGDFVGFLKGNIDQIQDNSLMYSTQGDKKAGSLVNKVQGNFAVALLAYNPGVIFKQQVSLETAKSAIDGKYISKSGASLGPLSFINPLDLFKRLTLSGDQTMLPVEWKQITDNPTYKKLMKYPMFRDRFEGMVSRETGEAVMGRQIQGDMITVPFKKGKDGKPLKISKSRLMTGITMMDSLTIMRLYNAVELETQDRMNEPAFQALTEEQIEAHNINRLQQIIDKTQPTFDQTNRSGLAKSSNPIWRVMTMFSSATQKIGEQMLDSMIEYNQNPTKANLNKMALRGFQTAITTSLMLTTIDILWAMAKGGWDDDDFDSIPEAYALGTFKSTLGSIHGVGTVLGVVSSQLDSKPWSQEIQDPFISIIQEGSESIANLAKGNFSKALKGSTNAVFKSVGIPITPINITRNYADKLLSEE
jgi:hypothetical protein